MSPAPRLRARQGLAPLVLAVLAASACEVALTALDFRCDGDGECARDWACQDGHCRRRCGVVGEPCAGGGTCDGRFCAVPGPGNPDAAVSASSSASFPAGDGGTSGDAGRSSSTGTSSAQGTSSAGSTSSTSLVPSSGPEPSSSATGPGTSSGPASSGSGPAASSGASTSGPEGSSSSSAAGSSSSQETSSSSGPCGPAEDWCPDGCWNLATHPQHCGSCERSCTAPANGVAVCTGRECGYRCLEGYSSCNSQCVDLKTDVNHCGDCDTPCPAQAHAEVRCEGGCKVTCLPGFADCGQGCQDVLQDAQNCMACGTVCTPPAHATAVCANGCTYRCQEGFTDCGGQCVDLTGDVQHCGGCATACTPPANATATCLNRTCGFTCTGGLVALGAGCAGLGGVYAIQGPACTVDHCYSTNPYTGACTCPGGFIPDGPFNFLDDRACPSVAPPYGWQSTYVCRAPTYTGMADYAGSYLVNEDGICAVANAYTGGCTCPAGTTGAEHVVDGGCWRKIRLGTCLNALVARSSFAGTFLVSDDTVCRTPNPATGSCTCPGGSTATYVRAIHGPATQCRSDGQIGALLAFCRVP